MPREAPVTSAAGFSDIGSPFFRTLRRTSWMTRPWRSVIRWCNRYRLFCRTVTASGHHWKGRSLQDKLAQIICTEENKDLQALAPLQTYLEDKENKFKKWINTSSKEFQELTNNIYVNQPQEFKKQLNKIGITYLKIDSKENYVKNLIKLFKYRKKQKWEHFFYFFLLLAST